MASESVILLSKPAEHVLEITLNRPDKLNAFNGELRASFRDAVRRITDDEDIRTAIITGSGRSFSVGADLDIVAHGSRRTTEDDRQNLLNNTLELFLDVWRAPVPVIAQVNGYCMGIATILVNCCDLVLIDEDAVVGWPVLPLGGGMVSPTWVWHVGLHKAKEMSFRIGSRMTGRESAEFGFANYSIPGAELSQRTLELATDIAKVERDLLAVKKTAINQVAARMGFEESVRIGAAWDALAHTTRAAQGARKELSELGLKGARANWGDAAFRPDLLWKDPGEDQAL